MLSHDIRQVFLTYFQSNGHEVVPSAPLVPQNDPTLLFVNAGMVPFKNMFTGLEKRPYTTAASAQKCVRAGGKHNDLENVGYTARHHTFFEMMGNFSFGAYFKEKAIYYAWTFLTKEMGIAPEKLYITYYAEDLEARDLWAKITGFKADRLIPIATKDNFWSMGNTGPCGPCSEIFYDHGPDIKGGLPGTPEEDGDRYTEIWNLVFMQYDQQEGGERLLLPKPSIDTGMGLERMAAVMQGTFDNYETDIFKALIEMSAALTQTDMYGPHSVSHRVIADHLRACSFLISDGVLPSNEGRGYVLRRIMRRAMRHAHMIDPQNILMHKLVPTLVEKMGTGYPTLQQAMPLIQETMEEEEKKFKSLLERGLRILDESISTAKPGDKLPGEIAFKLYDTYGFPLDLTQDALKRHQIQVDESGFNAAMTSQKEKARAAWKGSGDATEKDLWLSLKDKVLPTTFLGYTQSDGEGKVTAILSNGQWQEEVGPGSTAWVLMDQTPFYAESGGQMGDAGRVMSESGLAGTIADTQKAGGIYHIHKVNVESGTLAVGDVVSLHIDVARRRSLRANHSATHLLHAALRAILGPQVVQKGSLVAPDRLRFDFSYRQPVSTAQCRELEQIINQQITQNVGVTTESMAYDAAIESGVMALFGEKYDDRVRVVRMGEKDLSAELCGGTHVEALGDIGLFKIISETSVGAGVRRIEAVTGLAALGIVHEMQTCLEAATMTLKTTQDNLNEKITQLLHQKKTLEKEVRSLKNAPATASPEDVMQVGDVQVIVRAAPDVDAKMLRGQMDQLKKQHEKAVIFLMSPQENGKFMAVLGITQALQEKYNAKDIAQQLSQAFPLRGGGKPDLVQLGGMTAEIDINKLKEAIKGLL